MSGSEHVSVWLHPRPDVAAVLDSQIRRLAAEYDSVIFPAHLTVLGGMDLELDDALARFHSLAGQLEPVEVEFVSIQCEDVLHRSVYLVAMPTEQLRAAFDLGVEVWDQAGRHEFAPHLSLQYSTIPLEQKRELAAKVDLPLPMRVPFSSVSLWRTQMSDLRRWRCLSEAALLPTTAASAGDHAR